MQKEFPGELGSRDLSENVLLLQIHPSPYVRASVLRYTRKLFPDDAPLLLIAALKDAHPTVREKAIDELDDPGYYQALPDIHPFLYNQPEYVHQAARTAVKILTVLKRALIQNKAGRKKTILLESGFPESHARFARTHAQWNREASVQLEDILVAFADTIWKGTRDVLLEREIALQIARQCQKETWEVYMKLDDIACELAKGAHDRIIWQGKYPL